MSSIEIIASILGLISVFLVTKQNIWCWPTGIVMVLLYIVIFYQARLYSDMLLQVFFAIMQTYGWYFWLKRDVENGQVKVSNLKKGEWLIWILMVVLISMLLGIMMNKYTNADLPYIDAFTTALSIIAQWLMTKKKIENWILWIVADVIYIVMYFYKELYPTAILYLVFLVLAFIGYFDWKKEYRGLVLN